MKLVEMWKKRIGVDELSSHFQRKPGGIVSRLKKLGLE